MCGRYVNYEDVDALSAALGLSSGDPALRRLGSTKRYNIAPTQDIFAVRRGTVGPDSPLEGAALHWGLVPFWARDKAVGNRMINARSETAFEKPSFREAIRKRRCVVPASGFYEWKRTPGGKQPFFIHRSDGAPLLFAGLWEKWEKEGPPLESGVILTTGANATLAPIHDRMPVILDPAVLATWLDPGASENALKALLAPAPPEILVTRPVSTRVNKVSNDSPDLITEEPATPEFFDF